MKKKLLNLKQLISVLFEGRSAALLLVVQCSLLVARCSHGLDMLKF